jgi:hypothetical protein
MSSGGGQQQQTQTTKYELSPEQRELMSLAMPGIREFAAGGAPTRYPGETVAGFDPLQTAGQGQVLSAVGGMNTLAGSGAEANNFLLGDIWNPNTNPALQGAVDAAIRPITQQYQEVVRPALRDEFAGAGQQFGGSRRNLAEGSAAGKYMSQVGDTARTLVNDQYATNINAQLKALGLLPQTMQAQAMPGQVTSAVGDVRQSLAQEMLNSQVAGYNYDQLAPFLQSKEIMSLLAGIPGGQTTSTASVPQANKAMSSLGGAAAGASMGSMFGPVGMGVGAVGGGLLPWLT